MNKVIEVYKTIYEYMTNSRIYRYMEHNLLTKSKLYY